MLKLQDFKVGDKIVITSVSKSSKEKRSAVVTAINVNNLGYVTFRGLAHNGYLESGQGAFDPTKIGTTRFSLFANIEIV